MIRILLAAMVLFAFGAAAQTMYKWVDEKGVTHFSDEQPPDNKASKIDVKPPGNPTPRVDDWRKKEEDARQRRALKDTQEGEAQRREAAQRPQRCRNAQSGLDTAKNSRRLYNLDAKGERIYVEDSERPALIDKWEQEVRKYCD